MNLDTKHRSLTKSELHLMNLLWDKGGSYRQRIVGNVARATSGLHHGTHRDARTDQQRHSESPTRKRQGTHLHPHHDTRRLHPRIYGGDTQYPVQRFFFGLTLLLCRTRAVGRRRSRTYYCTAEEEPKGAASYSS